MAIIRSKDLIQSYVLSTAKYDFSSYEKRILYRLVDLCQQAIEGQKLDKWFVVQPQLFEGIRKVHMPISAFFKDEKDDNYKEVKKALKALRDKSFECVDEKGGWKVIGIIEMPRFHAQDKEIPKGFVEFYLHQEIFEAIVNFSRGYRKYELVTAMQMDSVYSMRFYELMSGQKTPQDLTIATIRERFGLQKKYKQNRDLIKKTVEVAKKELDAKSPWTFDFELIKKGREIHKIRFYPKFQPQFRDPALHEQEIKKQMSLSWDLDAREREYLNHQVGIDDNGIKNNRELITAVKGVKGHQFLDWLAELKTNALRQGIRSLPGYVIGAMKKVRDNELTK